MEMVILLSPLVLIEKKQIIAGATYNPILNEFYWAHKGSGAWI